VPISAYLLPLCVEWVILVTTLVPMLAWRFGDSRPNLAIGALFSTLGSAVVATALALLLASSSVLDLWSRLSAEPASQHRTAAILPALLTAMAPWALLALAGITIAIVNLRIEPAISAAKALHPRLASAVEVTGEFGGVLIGVVTAATALSFTTKIAGKQCIVVSSAALATLTDAELEAVYWHELGHIRGRHNSLKLVAQALQQVVPRIAASRVLVARLDALAELAADNFALKHVNRQTLLAARAKFA
jgi:Zn-dependent protease with chaperone function